MTYIVLTYVGVFAAVLLGSVFYWGYKEIDPLGGSHDEMCPLGAALAAGFLWPVVVAAHTIFWAVAWPYYLGRWIRKRKMAPPKAVAREVQK